MTSNVKRLKLKDGVLPHIFECQKKTKPPPERKGALKRKHIEMIEEALSVAGEPSIESQPSLSGSFIEFEPSSSFNIEEETNYKDKGVQVNIKKHFRSKGTNTHVLHSATLDMPQNASQYSASMQYFQYSTSKPDVLKIQMKEDISENSDEDFLCQSVSSENFSSEDESVSLQKYKEHMLKGTLMSIEKNPKLFLGLPPRSYFLIQIIVEIAPLSTRNIYIVLKKLRLNNQFAILGIDFGLSESSVCRIFNKSVPILAQLMQELIVWPSIEEVRKHLPIAFRARYANVVSIIDCLEIEKPSNPVHQALTWSNYYKCNTLKFLISCTPDGLVNFISEGYGGRASDVMIVENSGYLKKLPSGTTVMADRGFKHVSALLGQKGSALVRPPSVPTTSVSSKSEVKFTKRIAALRIHVERVIGRLRDFKMLLQNSCIDNHLIPHLDYLMIIACEIINMQNHLHKNQV